MKTRAPGQQGVSPHVVEGGAITARGGKRTRRASGSCSEIAVAAEASSPASSSSGNKRRITLIQIDQEEDDERPEKPLLKDSSGKKKRQTSNEDEAPYRERSKAKSPETAASSRVATKETYERSPHARRSYQSPYSTSKVRKDTTSAKGFTSALKKAHSPEVIDMVSESDNGMASCVDEEEEEEEDEVGSEECDECDGSDDDGGQSIDDDGQMLDDDDETTDKAEPIEDIPSHYYLQGGKTPSKYQVKVFKFIEESNKHGVIRAVAGSGKTSTLIKLIDLVHQKWPEKKILLLAFNKSVKEELADRIPRGSAVCQTMNAFGFNALRRYMVLEDRISGSLDGSVRDRDLFEIIPQKFFKKCRYTVDKMVERCKNNCWLTEDEVVQAIPPDVPDSMDPNDLVKWTCMALRQCLARFRRAVASRQSLQITFVDQLWLPVKCPEIAMDLFHFVFVDETQDINMCQLQLIKRVIDPNGGRLIAVGDPNQAIYGFRGAGCNAMDRLCQELRAETLSLSVCYRCPKHILQIAERIVKEIEPAPNAQNGRVDFMHECDLMKSLGPGDVVISRSNSAIVILALKLARTGVKTVIRNWSALQLRFKAILDEFHAQDSVFDLDLFLTKKSATIRKNREDHSIDGQNANEILDSIDVITAFSNDVKLDGIKNGWSGSDVSKLIMAKLKAFFSTEANREDNCIMLSTVHQVKGLEFPRVYILLPTFISPGNTEENNLLYVALTRAQEHLIVVGYDRSLLYEPDNRYVMFTNRDQKLRGSGHPLGTIWPFGLIRPSITQWSSSFPLALLFGG